MVRNFKGVVKIADVQEEFDKLLTSINNSIDLYNAGLNVDDIDYNNGGSDLSPQGYTLSIGGLKTVLAAYDGAVIGSKVFKNSEGQFIVSEGLYIKDGNILRLPSKHVNGSGNIVYYNKVTGEYSFSNKINQSGYYQIITTSTTSPAINGSDYAPLGSMWGTSAIYWAGNNYAQYWPFEAFPNNTGKWFATANGEDYILTWQFVNPTILSNISLQYGVWGGGYLQITDLNDNVLLSDSVSGAGTKAWKNYSGTFNTGDTLYNGIKIKVRGFNKAYVTDAVLSFATHELGYIRLTGTTQTKVWIPQEVSGNPEDFVEVSQVNTNRISKLCNTQNALNENIPNYNFKIASKNIGYSRVGEGLSNGTKGQIVSGMEACANAKDGTGHSAYLFGTLVSHNRRDRDMNEGCYWIPMNYLFIPKGLANPYSYNRDSTQRIFNYTLERGEYNI